MHQFDVWAPAVERVRVLTTGGPGPAGETVTELTAGPDGWWSVAVDDAGPGTDYAFLLGDDADDGALPPERPDPRSRWLPDGVHGRSRVYDASDFAWSDAGWTGRPLPGAVYYELHIATFTPGATFDTAIERLDHLVELGVTHVEVLPVNGVNGTWNWGYDGVAWYAVHEPLGGPDAFKRFVDACHGRGLAVVLDVVYNHFGPSGNYLPDFGPYLKTGKSTWGDLVNLDGAGSDAVRAYIVDNVRQWLTEYHLDGLRLDAVHALADESPRHILAEIADAVDALRPAAGRPLTLVAESDLNDARMVQPREAGGLGMDGQWTDDVHHSLHSTLTGETQGYYVDFHGLDVLAKVYTHAFFHDGTFSQFRGRKHGRPVDRALTPGYRFVVFLQDHDQVGNRAVGNRLPELTSHARLKIGATLLYTSPFTPMLWMGEEWAASTRWPFFTSHPEKELGEAVSKGRLEEFDGHGWDLSTMIDPQDPAAYREAILDWDEVAGDGHADVLATYRALAALRRQHADLADPRLDEVSASYSTDDDWFVLRRGQFRVVVNFAAEPQRVELDVNLHTPVFSTHVGDLLSGSFFIDMPPETAVITRIEEEPTS